MIVKELNITNVRAIEEAEFKFQKGFNLIVGVNGVGKTTVLDALRICFSRILPSISTSKTKAISFMKEDIRNDTPFLEVTIHFDIEGNDFRYMRRQWREKIAKDDPQNLERLRRSILETERLRDSARNLLRELEKSQELKDTDDFGPDKSSMKNAIKLSNSLPLFVYYSVNRSVISAEKGSSIDKAAGLAYADALNSRSWKIKEFSDWLRVQKDRESEFPLASKHLKSLQTVISVFLPECTDLRAGDEETGILLVNKAGTVLDVHQLSDGERGILSMALDLGRRLSYANPESGDPIKTGQAIVLIDEIDLHLHPKWQKEIVTKLRDTFPNCQFIATTHSPLIIGEIEHEQVQIMKNGKIYSAPYSYGVDSSRILEGIMDTDSRTSEVQHLLTKISESIGKEQFDISRELLSELIRKLGREDDPEVTGIRTTLNFLEGKD
jgi:predicted ATP-binding protein involved in virulence